MKPPSDAYVPDPAAGWLVDEGLVDELEEFPRIETGRNHRAVNLEAAERTWDLARAYADQIGRDRDEDDPDLPVEYVDGPVRVIVQLGPGPHSWRSSKDGAFRRDLADETARFAALRVSRRVEQKRQTDRDAKRAADLAAHPCGHCGLRPTRTPGSDWCTNCDRYKRRNGRLPTIGPDGKTVRKTA